jgi:transcriptional regulator with XRE-family HTH domain
VAPRSHSLAALGSALRSAREARGVSQERLGLESGLDRTYVGGVERGERNPSFETLLRFTRALDVPLSSLMVTFEERVVSKGMD